MNYLAVAIGSAFGGLSRYWLSMQFTGSVLPFPWTIAVVNVAGSFLIGWLGARPMAAEWRAFWLPGVCGGFTTFSTFSADTLALWQQSPIRALAYVVVSVTFSLLAAWLGMTLARRT